MRLDRLAALLAVLVVLGAGIAYVTTRPTVWQSDAKVVLVPAVTGPDAASPLDTFTTAGTLGTAVELLSSADLAGRVPVPGLTFSARAVTDSRVIALTARGPRGGVRDGLGTLLRLAGPAQVELSDDWRIAVLTRPTAAQVAGPSTAALLVVAGLLSVLAGVAVLAGAPRALPELAARRLGRRRRASRVAGSRRLVPGPGRRRRRGRRRRPASMAPFGGPFDAPFDEPHPEETGSPDEPRTARLSDVVAGWDRRR